MRWVPRSGHRRRPSVVTWCRLFSSVCVPAPTGSVAAHQDKSCCTVEPDGNVSQQRRTTEPRGKVPRLSLTGQSETRSRDSHSRASAKPRGTVSWQSLTAEARVRVLQQNLLAERHGAVSQQSLAPESHGSESSRRAAYQSPMIVAHERRQCFTAHGRVVRQSLGAQSKTNAP